jgi:hypothetical protein
MATKSPFVAPKGFKKAAAAPKILVALKRAVENSFDGDKWRELAYLVGLPSKVETHPRLLRSLYFNDDDYGSCVFQVLKDLAGTDFENLATMVEFVDLKAWLEKNDTALYSEICTGVLPRNQSEPHVPLEQCEKVGDIHSIRELRMHSARIRSGLEDGNDPELALGSAKDLLESVLKTVVGDHGQKPVEDIQSLLKRAQKTLSLDPADASASMPGSESLRRTLSNLGQIVVGVAELRTLYGTGHGRSRAKELKLAHARLVVNSAISVATFLLELWEEQNPAAPKVLRAEKRL